MFCFHGLDPDRFQPLFDLSDEALHQQNIHVVHADDQEPGYPCRVSLGHAAPGDRLLLLNHEHQPAASPYRSAHAIYVAQGSQAPFDKPDSVPEAVRVRHLSVRAFDANDMIVDADLVQGERVEKLIERLFDNDAVQYLHVHFAKRGCFAARVHRANGG